MVLSLVGCTPFQAADPGCTFLEDILQMSLNEVLRPELAPAELTAQRRPCCEPHRAELPCRPPWRAEGAADAAPLPLRVFVLDHLESLE